MASWIMVSSKWVLGLSTGSRPLSAKMTTRKEASASIRVGLAISKGWLRPARTIAGRFDVRAGIAMARIATSSAGSARAPMVIDRLEPMPPKAVPVSRALRASTTEPSSRVKMTAKKSVLSPSGGWVVAKGEMADTQTTVATSTRGPAPKSQLDSRGRMRCLVKSLRRSSKG